MLPARADVVLQQSQAQVSETAQLALEGCRAGSGRTKLADSENAGTACSTKS